MRRWIGLLCLLIIFFQGVPVKGICKLLGKQKTTVVADVNTDDTNDDEDDASLQAAPFDAGIILPDHSFHILPGRLYFKYKQTPIISKAEVLSSVYAAEVAVPPPDRA